jgi:uncharacterized protein YigE (DUF2233 family)
MWLAALAPVLLVTGSPAAPPPWEALEPGLDMAWFDGPGPAAGGGGRIAVVRVDPARFDLRLLNASAPGEGKLRTVRAWAERAGAVAAINASMYQEDYRTSVGLMRTHGHVNRSTLARHNAILAFDPLASGVPRFRIIDRECEDFAAVAEGYGSLVQSIRMVSCDRRNVWARSEERFSTAAIGIDRSGRLLLLHARTPWAVHDLVDALLALPLELSRAMYAEGGAEAQLYLRSGDRELELVGGFAAVAESAVDNREAWPVPNVIAVVRRRTGPPPPSGAASGK